MSAENAEAAKLNEAGIPCGVLVAPVLPGISDSPDQLEDVVTACIDAGATVLAAASSIFKADDIVVAAQGLARAARGED